MSDRTTSGDDRPQPPENIDPTALVRAALARTRADADNRQAARTETARQQESRAAAGTRREAREVARADAPPPGTSQPAPGTGRPRIRRPAGPQREDSVDPVPLGNALDGFLASRGWSGDIAVARVTAHWEKVVGPELAEHCQPVHLVDGELTLEATSTAWATQLRLLSRTVLDRIAAEVGTGVVDRLRVRGPSAPSWTHGRLRVRGRGPRDTYG
jgi:predicted nucleic acid-binding Zn ribbon protein